MNSLACQPILSKLPGIGAYAHVFMGERRNFDAMNLAEKLRQIVVSKSEVDRAAGLPANTTSNVVNSGSVPNVYKAFRIARALGVSLDWLADDSQGMPPVPAGHNLTFTSLMTPEDRDGWVRMCDTHGRDVAMAAAATALVKASVEDAAVAIARIQVARDRRATVPRKMPGVPPLRDVHPPRRAAKKAPPRGGKSPGYKPPK